jgi:hypothetical protein
LGVIERSEEALWITSADVEPGIPFEKQLSQEIVPEKFEYIAIRDIKRLVVDACEHVAEENPHWIKNNLSYAPRRRGGHAEVGNPKCIRCSRKSFASIFNENVAGVKVAMAEVAGLKLA